MQTQNINAIKLVYCEMEECEGDQWRYEFDVYKYGRDDDMVKPCGIYRLWVRSDGIHDDANGSRVGGNDLYQLASWGVRALRGVGAKYDALFADSFGLLWNVEGDDNVFYVLGEFAGEGPIVKQIREKRELML